MILIMPLSGESPGQYTKQLNQNKKVTLTRTPTKGHIPDGLRRVQLQPSKLYKPRPFVHDTTAADQNLIENIIKGGNFSNYKAKK